MSFMKSKSDDSYKREQERLEKERLAKLAKMRKKNRNEGADNVYAAQQSRTILTNPLGLGDSKLG